MLSPCGIWSKMCSITDVYPLSDLKGHRKEAVSFSFRNLSAGQNKQIRNTVFGKSE